MNSKIGKLLIVTWLITCLSIIGSFLVSDSVLAQEPVKTEGWIAGGHSDSIPIELKVGEMVQGEIIGKEALMLTIDDPAGKEVQNFGEIVHGSFSYAAKIDGKHYIVITNPNRWAIGTRGYTLTYTILPTDLGPGTGSGKAIGEKSIIPWIIAGVVILVVIFLIVFIRRRKQQRELEDYRYEHYGRWQRYSVEQLAEEILHIKSKRNQLQRTLDAESRAASKVIIGDIDSDIARSQMQDIIWKLEELGREEEDIRQVIRERKAKQQRV
ncbi:MAG: hypothetical protein Q8O55_07055 [Dehalococcoidales bacterium]|nr:hypothetical protein [Dehalococcoidales bacterium]